MRDRVQLGEQFFASQGRTLPFTCKLDLTGEACACLSEFLSAFGLGLDPFREDDGGAGCAAPAQGAEEVFGEANAVCLVPPGGMTRSTGPDPT
jgi:hypothetical protein